MSNLVATIYSFVLADSSSAPKVDKLPSLSVPQAIVDFVNSNSLYQQLYKLLPFLVIFITFAGTLFLNLDRIIGFFQKYLLRKQVDVSETELFRFRKQLLKRLQNDISIRRRTSLHELIKIDLKKEEQPYQVARDALDLVPEDKESRTTLNRVFEFFRRADRKRLHRKSDRVSKYRHP